MRWVFDVGTESEVIENVKDAIEFVAKKVNYSTENWP